MPKVLLEGPDSRALLDERARLGLDRFDELWIDDERVIHVVPAPQSRPQLIEAGLLEELRPAARGRGLTALNNTGVHPPGGEQYRIPDIVVFDVAHLSRRGLEEHATAVIEIVSPGDESWAKVAYYLDVGCGEVVLIERDTLEVAIVRGLDDGGEPIVADDATIRALDITLTRVTDDHLRLTGADGSADIELPEL